MVSQSFERRQGPVIKQSCTAKSKITKLIRVMSVGALQMSKKKSNKISNAPQ